MRNDFVVDFDNPQEVAEHIRWMKMQRGVQIVHYQPKSEQRSIDINSYYWTVIEYISDWTGMSKVDLHFFFKNTFLPNVTFQKEFDLSTTDCSNEEMWEYIQNIKSYTELLFFEPDHVCSTERQFTIPDPKSVIRVPRPPKERKPRKSKSPGHPIQN